MAEFGLHAGSCGSLARIQNGCQPGLVAGRRRKAGWRMGSAGAAGGRGAAGGAIDGRDSAGRSGPAYSAGAGISEEHTSELQSLMRNSYAVVCLTKKKNTEHNTQYTI